MKDFSITFKWMGAATWVLKIDDIKIACDPVLCAKGTIQEHKYFKGKRRTSPQFVDEDFKNIDFWLLTHSHEDHIDVYGVTKIEPSTQIYADYNLKNWLKLIYAKNVDYMKWGEKKIFQKDNLKVTIEAIPCVHASNYIVARLAGSVNGYWLTIEKNNSAIEIYVSGDTVNHKKVKKHLKGYKADIMIPFVGAGGLTKLGGPYTFTANQVIDMAKIINPTAILPVHHKTFSIYEESIDKLYEFNDDRVIKFNEGETIKL